MSATLHVGAVGVPIHVYLTDETGTAADLTGETVTVYLRKPDGSVLSVAGVVQSPATSGHVVYTTAAGDIDAAGWWRLQTVELASGRVFPSDVAEFEVKTNIGAL